MSRLYGALLFALYSIALVNCAITKRENKEYNDDDPPNHDDHIAMARYIMHKAGKYGFCF